MAMRSLGYMPSEVELAIIMQRLDMDGESSLLALCYWWRAAVPGALQPVVWAQIIYRHQERSEQEAVKLCLLPRQGKGR